VVHTDHPKQSEVKISVGGFVFGPISVTPERVRMTNVVGTEGASRDLILVVSGGKPTEFKVAEKPAKVDVSVERDDTATLKGRYRMTVKVPPGTAAGEVHGDILLKTDHPTVHELKIPVDIFISRSRAGRGRSRLRRSLQWSVKRRQVCSDHRPRIRTTGAGGVSDGWSWSLLTTD